MTITGHAVAASASTLATIGVQALPTATEWESIAKLPVLIILGLIATFQLIAIVRMNRTALMSAERNVNAMLAASEAHHRAAESTARGFSDLAIEVKGLAAELRGKPCMAQGTPIHRRHDDPGGTQA